MFSKEKIMLKKYFLILLIIMLSSAFVSAESANEARVKKMFSNLKYYKYIIPHSAKIDEVYIGYDKDDTAVKGIAVEKADIYKKITIVLSVEKKGNKLVVSSLNVPDINKISDAEKVKKLKAVLNSFKSRNIEFQNGNYSDVDAVSGSTRFIEKGHKTINNMIKTLTYEMKNNPDWERVDL